MSKSEVIIKEGLRMQSGNSILNNTRDLPELKKLFGDCWVEGEICVFVGDSNVGKTILAMQIGLAIADPKRIYHSFNIDENHFEVNSSAQEVLFFNFELSDRKIAKRFRADDGTEFEFPENFRLISFDDYTKDFQKGIESMIEHTGAKVIIIDNLSRFQAYGYSIEQSDDAMQLIQWFESIRKKYGCSILLVHHPAKRKPFSAWTINCLAGSKKIANSVDSIFAMGKDLSKGQNYRYVKQLKVRDSELKYSDEQVASFEVSKPNVRLKVEYVGMTGNEMSCLKVNADNQTERNETISYLSNEGLSYRDIGDRVNLSHTQVANIIGRHNGKV
jgi:KaiC/GvpD/RAD55 family RecA-like ATPase